MDTSPEAPPGVTNPLVHRNYDGSDIMLDARAKIKLSPNEFPELKGYEGKTLITSVIKI